MNDQQKLKRLTETDLLIAKYLSDAALQLVQTLLSNPIMEEDMYIFHIPIYILLSSLKKVSKSSFIFFMLQVRRRVDSFSQLKVIYAQ